MAKQTDKKNKKSSLRNSFAYTAMILLVVMGLIISIVSYSQTQKYIYNEVENGMENIAYTVANSYDALYPGQYVVVTKNELSALAKGDKILTNELLDNISDDTDVNITIFFNDVRMLTTLQDDNGNRLLGTKMNINIKKKVLESDESCFYNNVKIDGTKCFAFYLPVHNTSGQPIGAISILRDKSDINKRVAKSVVPIIVIIMLSMGIADILIYRHFKTIEKSFNEISSFLSDVERGKLKNDMNQDVLSRLDELGDMAKISVSMQKSIRELVEYDPLTKLYNRRYGNEHLKVVKKRAEKSSSPYAIAIVDIDFFKKVNDTYGHDAGDVVLVAVAGVLRQFMRGKGFVARWGGEEFLLLFENCFLKDADKALNGLLGKIREIEIAYGEQIIKVTISAGVANAYGIDLEQAIKQADDRLYYAKEHGRNQVVSKIE